MSDQESEEVAVELVPDDDQEILNRRLQEADELEAGGESPFPQPRHEYVVLRLGQLKTSINDSFLEMAGLLVETSAENHWRECGFECFADFVETTVGMKYRTARYLMTVHETFVSRLNVPRPMLMEIGWTKLKEIAKVSDADNVNEWLETARNNRTSALIQIVRQQTTTETVEEYSTLSIGCFQQEKVTIQAALELAQLESQSDRPGHNMAMICADYAAGARERQGEAAPATDAPEPEPDDDPATERTQEIEAERNRIRASEVEELPRGEPLPEGPRPRDEET